MKLRTAAELLRSGQAGVLLSLSRLTPSYYRVCFLGTAAATGLLRRLAPGPASLDQLAGELATPAGREGLEAWLDFGVSLGLLHRRARGLCATRSALPRAGRSDVRPRGGALRGDRDAAPPVDRRDSAPPARGASVLPRRATGRPRRTLLAHPGAVRAGSGAGRGAGAWAGAAPRDRVRKRAAHPDRGGAQPGAARARRGPRPGSGGARPGQHPRLGPRGSRPDRGGRRAAAHAPTPPSTS